MNMFLIFIVGLISVDVIDGDSTLHVSCSSHDGITIKQIMELFNSICAFEKPTLQLQFRTCGNVDHLFGNIPLSWPKESEFN